MLDLIENHWGRGIRLAVCAEPRQRPAVRRLVDPVRAGMHEPIDGTPARRPQQRVDLSAVLPAIQVPTLVLHRRDNPLVPLEAGREAAALIPGARFIEADGTDGYNWPGADDPESDLIEEFLTGPYPAADAGADARDGAVHRPRGIDGSRCPPRRQRLAPGARGPQRACPRPPRALPRTRGQDARRRFRGHVRRPDTRGPLCSGDRGGPGHTWTADQVRLAHRRVRAVGTATSAGSPCTSGSASARWPTTARCSCRAPSRTWWSAPRWSSTIGVSTAPRRSGRVAAIRARSGNASSRPGLGHQCPPTRCGAVSSRREDALSRRRAAAWSSRRPAAASTT